MAACRHHHKAFLPKREDQMTEKGIEMGTAGEREAPDDQPTAQVYARLRSWVSDRLQGGCKMLSQGSDCMCALCDLDRLRERASREVQPVGPEIPKGFAFVSRNDLRNLVDVVWSHACVIPSVPETATADVLIDKALGYNTVPPAQAVALAPSPEPPTVEDLHETADTPREVLLGKTLRQYAHEALWSACTAWSDVLDNDGAINEAKCELAAAQERRLRAAINELADLAAAPAAEALGSDKPEKSDSKRGLDHAAGQLTAEQIFDVVARVKSGHLSVADAMFALHSAAPIQPTSEEQP